MRKAQYEHQPRFLFCFVQQQHAHHAAAMTAAAVVDTSNSLGQRGVCIDVRNSTVANEGHKQQ
jgi:hypothetical protein